MPKKNAVPVPKDLPEAAIFLAEMGEQARCAEQIENDLNEAVSKLTADAAKRIQAHQERVKKLLQGLFAYAEKQKKQLIVEKEKTVRLPTGVFGWRTTPFSVSIDDDKSVIKNLKSLDLERFIRVKESIDKQAMLKERSLASTVQGVTIAQREEFFAKPAKVKLTLAIDLKKLKQTAG